MKAELEAIWRKNEIANPNHITGWLEEKNAKRFNKGYNNTRFSNILVAVKCRKVALKLRRK